MTKNEIKEATLEDAIYCAKAMACIEVCEECRFYGLCHTWCDDVYGIMIEALEEVQQYREIGTIEEFKALKEKNEPKELAEHNFQDEVHHYLCPACRSIVSCTQNYCEECGQALET